MESASPILSKPAGDPVGRQLSFTGNSIASRSRIALAYSSRFSRRITGRPAYGVLRAAASRSLTRPVVNAFSDAESGRGIPGGGISPAFSLWRTFSHTSGRGSRMGRTESSSTSPPVLDFSLWQDAQYRSRKACLESGDSPERPANGRARKRNQNGNRSKQPEVMVSAQTTFSPPTNATRCVGSGDPAYGDAITFGRSSQRTGGTYWSERHARSIL